MNNSKKTGCWYSWTVIIITLILFWPLGLFLLIKRVSIDKKAALVMGKLVGILGIICYCIVALGVIACISEGFHGDDVAVMLSFVFLGVVLRVIAKRVKKNAQIAVSPDGVPTAPNIASTAPEKTRIIHCPYCGANSTVYGKIGECEYCGSPLQ